MEGLQLPWIPRLQGFRDTLEARLSFDFSVSILLFMGYYPHYPLWGNSAAVTMLLFCINKKRCFSAGLTSKYETKNNVLQRS